MIFVYDPQQDKIVPKGEEQRTYTASVISDNMNPLLNHADGRVYDSKSSFRHATRAKGYREVGNDTVSQNRGIRGDFNVKKELQQAIQQHLR